MTVRWRGKHTFDSLHATVLSGGELFEIPGKTYYVNNIVGQSGNSGLSWAQAVDEVDTAIALAEAYRAAQESGNQNIRNRIVIQGTNTGYDNVDSTNVYWLDIIGLGSPAQGNGQGVVWIEAANTEDAWASSGNYFGNYMFNVCLLVTATGYWCQDLALCVQSTWEHCAFTTNVGGDMASGGGLRAITAFGGCNILYCHFNTQGAGQLYTGLDITGANNNNEIAHNLISATAFGLNIKGTDTNNYIHDNKIYSGRVSGTLAVGIKCMTHSLVADNRISADDAISGATAGHTVDNQVAESGVAARELA